MSGENSDREQETTENKPNQFLAFVSSPYLQSRAHAERACTSHYTNLMCAIGCEEDYEVLNIIPREFGENGIDHQVVAHVLFETAMTQDQVMDVASDKGLAAYTTFGDPSKLSDRPDVRIARSA